MDLRLRSNHRRAWRTYRPLDRLGWLEKAAALIFRLHHDWNFRPGHRQRQQRILGLGGIERAEKGDK